MKNIIYFLLVVLISSCSSQIQFSEPQPPATPNISNFNDDQVGIYLANDSNIIQILPQAVITSYLSANADSTSDVKLDGTLKINNQVHQLNVLSDLKLNFKADTLATLNQNGVLKKFKNNYYLNVVSDHGYILYCLTFSNNSLILKQQTENDRSILDDLVAEKKTLEDSASIFKPKFSEFKEYIKQKDAFANSKKFYKIN
ncbi:MAG: hypothetical protein JNK61_03995 [Bacteroidia bacterium]|nr:hypothetical protein [Bacteroidia bacterium]HQU99831.1 hypothetical protein [Bacteroidia bacterium]